MEQSKESIKKVYPSQVNTKSLACRVPTADYVNFLQDAISKGINLNDWLLMRVYSDKTVKQEIQGVETAKNHKIEEEYKEEFYPLFLNISTGNRELYFEDEDELISYVDSQNNKIEELINNCNTLKELAKFNAKNKTKISDLDMKDLDFSDDSLRMKVKVSLLKYVSTLEWESDDDLKEIKEDIRGLFNDIG